jgi:hypothetical protein
MPINYKLYPPNWKTEIRPAILKRANNCCEYCGVKNYSRGARDFNGEWFHEIQIDNMNSDTGFWHFQSMHVKTIKIVLTIAHLDHDVANNDHSNLKALCQKCHLSLDHNQHRENARKTNQKKKGLQSLF